MHISPRHPALLALLALAGCAHPVAPAPDKPLAPSVRYHGRFFTFPSGLRLLVYDDPQAPEVTLDVSHAAGARDEGPAQAGLAHLAEHLAFRGRQLGPEGPTLGERLGQLVAETNALTSPDSTDYVARARPDQLHALLGLEAQRMKDPLAQLTEAEFAAEREVVINELRERTQTSPLGAQLGRVLEAAFPGQVYGRPTGGTEAALRALTPADARAWFAEQYAPERTTLVVTGPVDPQEVERFVGAVFGPLARGRAGEPARPPAARPAPAIDLAAVPQGGQARTLPAPVDRPYLWLAWPVPGVYAGEQAQARYAAALVRAALEASFAGDERVEGILTELLPFDGAGLVVARLALASERGSAEVLERARERVHALASFGLGNLLATVKLRGFMLTQNFLALEYPVGPEAAQHLRATGQPDYAAAREAEIRQGLAANAGPWVRQHFSREQGLALLLVPDLARAPPPARGGRPGGSASERGEAPAADGLGAAVSAEAVRAAARPPGLDGAVRHRLANGLTAVVLRRPRLPLVEARLVLPRPDLARGDSAALAELAAAASWAQARPPGGGDTARIGGALRREVAGDRLVVGAEVPSGNLDNVLADLERWLADPDPDREVLITTRALLARSALARDARPAVRAERALREALFPGHPAGVASRSELLADLTGEQVGRWLERALQPEQAALVVVGDVEPGPELWARLEARLGSWHASGSPARGQAPLPSRSRRVVLLDRPGAAQAELRLALAGPAVGPGEPEAARALLAELLEAELGQALRVEQGVSYGVGVERERLPGAEVLTLRTAVDAAALGRALTLALARLEALRDAPAPEPALARARWRLARSYALAFDTLGQAAAGLADQAVLGWPADAHERWPAALAGVGPGAVQQAARELGAGREAVVVVGDRRALEPQLRAAGLDLELR